MKTRLSILLLTILLTSGCATNYSPSACEELDPEFYTETSDPLESMNRAVFKFNITTDKYVLQPLVTAYADNANATVKTGVLNFYNNLKEVRNITASLLMGKTDAAANSGTRFVLNSTIGLLGFIDIGSAAGIPYKDYDFGQTLGYWGVKSGPYIEVPILGPYNLRDAFGAGVRYVYVNPMQEIEDSNIQTGLQAGSLFIDRVKLEPMIKILETQPDPYLFVRESYRQNRLHLVCNP